MSFFKTELQLRLEHLLETLLALVKVLLLGIMVYEQAAAQGWQWSTPTPSGDYCQSVCFVDTSNGWLVSGSSGFIFHTSDGGRTWDPQDLGERAYIATVTFVDNQYGWVAGGNTNGVIFRTTNSGKSWVRGTTPPDGLPLISLQFFGRDTGFSASQNNMILKTTDGGRTWVKRRVNYNYLGATFFLNSNTGFVVGNAFYATSNGGDTWDKRGDQSGQFCGIYFRDTLNGWLAEPHEGLLATTDGGRSWESKTSSVITLSSVTFVDPGHGFAWGGSGQYSSVDSGMTWARSIDTLSFGNGQMLSPTLGFNAAGFGSLFRTTDGGASWANLCSKVTSVVVSGIALRSQNEIWAAGGSNLSGGELLVSTDRGTSWSKKVVHFPQWLRDIAFTDSLTGWAVGGQGSIVTSTNGGDLWISRIVGSANLKTVTFVNHDHGWCGGAGVVLSTTDGGLNWSTSTIANGDDINSIYFKNQFEGWVCGGSVNESRGHFSRLDEWVECR